MNFCEKKNGKAKIPPLEMYFPWHVLASVVPTAGPGCTIINVSISLHNKKA
jgi:hypothetical protein